MMSSVSCTELKPLLFSSPIYPSTHLPFYFLGVPGKQKGWMSRHGHALKPDKDGLMVCPESGYRYKEVSPETLKCLDLNEEEPLPEKLAKGSDDYRTIKEKKKMMSSVSCTEFKPLRFSSPIYSSTHLSFYFLGVSGKQKGWMSRHGHVLKPGLDGIMVCPERNFR